MGETLPSVNTSDWITLVGALGSIIAASVAALALRRIADERRRTFNLGLIVELSKALIGPAGGGPNTGRGQVILRILPAAYMPLLRAHWGQATEDQNALYARTFNTPPRHAEWGIVIEHATIEMAQATDQLLNR